MLLFRLLLHKNFLFFLVYFLGALFVSENQVYASEISSLYAQRGTIERGAHIQNETKTIFGKEFSSQMIIAEASIVQGTVEQNSKEPKQQEGRTLKLWGIHKEGEDKNTPVTVSTTNATLSVIKKAQLHEKQLPSTNSTLLPGLNATLPVIMPSSNMPQITPITDW